jgi:hypothetical protein
MLKNKKGTGSSLCPSQIFHKKSQRVSEKIDYKGLNEFFRFFTQRAKPDLPICFVISGSR